MQMGRFVAQLFDFAFGVGTFQRRQVDHAESHLQALHLGFFLDAAGRKPLRSLNNADLIDRRRTHSEVGRFRVHTLTMERIFVNLYCRTPTCR